MVALDAWQTLPAIERTQIRQDTESWGRTIGGIRNGTNGGSGQQHAVPESSTLDIKGKTNPGGTQTQDLKGIELRPQREKQHTRGFSEYLFTRKTAHLISLLKDLKPNLQRIEGAGIMVAFRRSLEEIWHVAGQLPREKVLVVSAVEEAVRSTKWRELSVGQVDVLQRVLSNVSTPVEISRQEVSRAFRAINRSRIDVFPSALVDEEDEDGLQVDAAE